MDTSRRSREFDGTKGPDGLRLDLLKTALKVTAGDDRLTPRRRQAVLSAALEAPAAGPAWGLAPLLDLRKALAAAAVLVVAVAALVVFQQQAPVPLQPASAAVGNLEVSASEDGIVLHWASQGGSYRVTRATDPRALDSAPAEVVQGNSWVDPETNGAQIVFYRVEEVL